jgi:hypothetical protein
MALVTVGGGMPWIRHRVAFDERYVGLKQL